MGSQNKQNKYLETTSPSKSDKSEAELSKNKGEGCTVFTLGKDNKQTDKENIFKKNEECIQQTDEIKHKLPVRK